MFVYFYLEFIYYTVYIYNNLTFKNMARTFIYMKGIISGLEVVTNNNCWFNLS